MIVSYPLEPACEIRCTEGLLQFGAAGVLQAPNKNMSTTTTMCAQTFVVRSGRVGGNQFNFLFKDFEQSIFGPPTTLGLIRGRISQKSYFSSSELSSGRSAMTS